MEKEVQEEVDQHFESNAITVSSRQLSEEDWGDMKRARLKWNQNGK